MSHHYCARGARCYRIAWPVQVASGVVGGFHSGLDLGLFAVSATGNLALVPGNVDLEENHVMRVRRNDGSADPYPFAATPIR